MIHSLSEFDLIVCCDEEEEHEEDGVGEVQRERERIRGFRRGSGGVPPLLVGVVVVLMDGSGGLGRGSGRVPPVNKGIVP